MDLTLFEFHLDGAQFGPKTMGSGRGAGETGGASSGRNGLGVLLPVLVVLGVAGYAVARRLRRGESSEGSETVEIAA